MLITNYKMPILAALLQFFFLWACTKIQPGSEGGREQTAGFQNEGAASGQEAQDDPAAAGLDAASGKGGTVDPRTPKGFLELKSARTKRYKKISAFSLDDSAFLVHRFVVGLKTYMTSESPQLSYDIPASADYVQLYRCPLDISLLGAVDSIPLEDVEVMEVEGASNAAKQEERARIYRRNDFVTAAIKAGCTMVSTGITSSQFYDSWAPSGNYRYLIVACVASNRLEDTEQLTTRACSRQIAVTQALRDYVNSRLELQNKLLEQANQISTKIDEVARQLKTTADQYNDEITRCEQKGYERAVSKAKKDAIVSIAAISLDVFIELKTAPTEGKGLIRHYLGSGGFMDKLQLLGAMQGYSFSAMFAELGTRSEDFPRACSRGIAIDERMTAITQNYTDLILKYQYTMLKSQYAKQLQDADADELSPDMLDQGGSVAPAGFPGGP